MWCACRGGDRLGSRDQFVEFVDRSVPSTVPVTTATTAACTPRTASASRFSWGKDATGKKLNDTLRRGEFDVIHYAGHASFAAVDPDMSGPQLHGGELFHAEKIQLGSTVVRPPCST